MSQGDTCYICKCDVGAKGGIVLANCFGGCAQRNYCRDCIVKWDNIMSRECPICKKFLYLTVWTGTKMFVAFTCIILYVTAILVHKLEQIKLDAMHYLLVVILFVCRSFQLLYLVSFIFIENFGPITEWCKNMKSWMMYIVVTPIYHLLSFMIKPVTLYAILGLLCIWVAFISTTFAGSNVGTPCY